MGTEHPINKRLNLPSVALVVEDDHMTALLCTRALEALGLQVMCCETSLKAAKVAQLHEHRIQLMLVDVVLASPAFRLSQHRTDPEDDGARLLSLLTHFCSEAVAVQMSAYSKQELMENGYQIEAEHFLEKPFTLTTLRTLVKTLLPDLKVPSQPILPASDVTWCG
jgi:CheY-like chemotaxis protein